MCLSKKRELKAATTFLTTAIRSHGASTRSVHGCAYEIEAGGRTSRRPKVLTSRPCRPVCASAGVEQDRCAVAGERSDEGEGHAKDTERVLVRCHRIGNPHGSRGRVEAQTVGCQEYHPES